MGAAGSLRARGVTVESSGLRAGPLLDALGVRRPRSLGDTWDIPALGETLDLPEAGANTTVRNLPTELPPLGRFELGDELGRGGMGRVLEAKDPELRRRVAVKVLLDPESMDPNQLSRFVGEAQLTSQLEHPNIVPVHEMGVTEDGQIYFVMKKVTGRSLGEVLTAIAAGSETEWSQRRLLSAFVQVGQAIAYAHDRGVLHRDLKPDNIMLGAFGEVLVMDWGLARVEGDEPEQLTTERIDRVAISRTLDGAVIGTPGYMSPEQAQGLLAHLDARSDVFALGAILYELLTLKRPYEGDDVLEVLLATLAGPPQDPHERAPDRDVPDELAAIALRAMARKPSERYQSASEIVRAVEAYLEGSKRRAEAAVRVGHAEARWTEYQRYHVEETNLRAREKQLVAEVKPWAPLDDPGKQELLAVRERLEEIGPERATKFGKAVAAAEQALSHAPDHAAAKDFLARAYWSRFEAAERARDVGEQAYYADRVREYDRGHFLPKLEGIGALTLATDPPGAEVWCERYEQKGLVWPLVEKRLLGRTPIQKLPMEMGSYLLTIVSPGKRDTRYPVYITRGKHWHSGDEPIPLYTDEEIGEGFVYVPAGEFFGGGGPLGSSATVAYTEPFCIGNTPVTVREYIGLLNAQAEHDPDEAFSRVPRKEESAAGHGAQYWKQAQDGHWDAEDIWDIDGERWLPSYPIMAIDHSDCVEYARHASLATGLLTRLPSELEWEKSARGVDGREFTWGDRFEPRLAHMLTTFEGRPHPGSVAAHPRDCSPYGVLDMCGLVREWMEQPDDAPTAPVRGGSWLSHERHCRTTNRWDFERPVCRPYIGLRLAHTPERK